jgi:adenine-specific DNA methylase
MIPQSCKRLAEVDFPIAVVSKHAAREKSIRHGHPSTLHLWWARRPLAACRAVLLGLLLPDPCDPLCPANFKSHARAALRHLPGVGNIGDDDKSLRRALLKFVGDFSAWELSSDKQYLDAARGLVRAAHPDETPLVVDPFAGGGSIPLEALRLGCDAFASDLNPVACLILKVMLEDIPRYGSQKVKIKRQSGEEVEVEGLAEALRIVGAEIKAAAEKELAEFYPTDGDGARPIAYLWARTVRCESPNCGAEIPLVRSFWLSKKSNRKRALQTKVVRKRGETPRIEFEIFEPKKDSDVPNGTVARAKATCLCCGTVLPPDRVRAQLREQRGGADVIFDAHGKPACRDGRGAGRRIGGARLLAVVTLKSDEQGRHYRLQTERDYDTVWRAQKRLEQVAATRLKNGLAVVPDEPTPAGGGSGAGRAFSVQIYGMMKFGDLFSSRQKLASAVLARVVQVQEIEELKELLAFVVSGISDHNSSLCAWRPTSLDVGHTFGRQVLPVSWDYAEVVPIGSSTGSIDSTLDRIVRVVDAISHSASNSGQVENADATESPLLPESASVWFTDPPYYDAIPYSDLSDFFFVWMRRTIPNHQLLRDRFDSSNPLSPKIREVVQDEIRLVNGHPKDRKFFEETMAKAFAQGRHILRADGIGSVVFAHKTTEGWEALLSGMIRGGWVITGSWPLATEMSGRLRARESAALATSIHLVCRPRTEDEIGDWGNVVRELPKRVADWMERLQSEGVRGADLVFACIGPALEIYSRYSQVVDAEEREIPLGGDPEAKEPHKRGYLAYVWEVVGRAALEQVLGTAEARARNGAALPAATGAAQAGGALEEDARLTALFLWTLQSTTDDGRRQTAENGQRSAVSGQSDDDTETESDENDEEETSSRKPKGFALVFDVVRRFAQPLGIHLQDWEGRIIETEKGVVRLLAVSERARQLFGEEGAQAVAAELERNPERAAQLSLFPEMNEDAVPKLKTRTRKGGQLDVSTKTVSDESLRTRREATTLDRVHAAMLLQKSGRTNALRAMLKAEIERGPDFLRLANALSALYPRESEEKRLLDAMLLAVPR